MMSEKEFDNRPSRERESGFSMIEMLIAIVVVTFGLVSIVGISAYVSRANSTSATLNVLAAAAQDQVDRLRTARWTRTLTDPMLTVGGTVPAMASVYETGPVISNPLRPKNAFLFVASPAPLPSPSPSPSVAVETYTYTLDPENPHHATAAGTPAGDLNINWQVRQGATPDIRYVTINVRQFRAPANLANGFTVSTMIIRN
jgi:prepilin-type N-terminal cleavage/methylation domain-containing protein